MQQTHRRAPPRIIALTVFLAVLVSESTASAQEEKTFLKEHYVLGPVRVFYIKEVSDATVASCVSW